MTTPNKTITNIVVPKGGSGAVFRHKLPDGAELITIIVMRVSNHKVRKSKKPGPGPTKGGDQV